MLTQSLEIIQKLKLGPNICYPWLKHFAHIFLVKCLLIGQFNQTDIQNM